MYSSSDSDLESTDNDKNKNFINLISNQKNLSALKNDSNLIKDFIPFTSKSNVINSDLESNIQDLNYSIDYKKPMWITTRTSKIENPLEGIHEELIDIQNQIKSKQREGKDKRSQLVNRIDKVCKQLYPHSSIEIFGSSATGLQLEGSDIDIVLVNVDEDIFIIMSKLSDELVKKNLVSHIEVIENTKIPLIKLTDKLTGINVDISFNTQSGLNSTIATKKLIVQFPELKQILIFFKIFLRQRSLHDTYRGGMGSQLLMVLIIFFLQTHKSRDDEYYDLHNKFGLGHQLLDFLQFYSQHFDYSLGISISQEGCTYDKIRNPIEKFAKDKDAYLSVENPMDHGHDLGARVKQIRFILSSWKISYEMLMTGKKDRYGSQLSKIIIPDRI